jgi:hypothetical protein
MSSTFFQDYNQNNPIVSSWLNDINNGVYTPTGTAKVASASAAAWVRFSISGGVVMVQQSYNVAGVSRTSAGVYVVSYEAALTETTNCYEISMDQAGFTFRTAETSNSVTIGTTNTSNTSFDPDIVSVVIHGEN